MTIRLCLLVLLGCAGLVTANPGDHAEAEPEVMARRRYLQEYNRNSVAKLRSLLVDHLSQSPATPMPYPPRPAARRRRLASAAKPYYSTQCLYEPPPPPSDSSPDDDSSEQQPSGSTDDTSSSGPSTSADGTDDTSSSGPSTSADGTDDTSSSGPSTSADGTDDTSSSGPSTSADGTDDTSSSDPSTSAGPQQQQQSEDQATATSRRHLAQSEEEQQQQQQQEDGSSTPPDAPPPSSPPASPPDAPTPPVAPPTGTCYLNPAVLAHPDFPDPETPIEIMLIKSAWTAYQCGFEKRPGRCGTYRHEPYDCRWQPDPAPGRCAVPSDYLLPRLLAYLHCRDDATITPFWDRCYRVGVLSGDNDWCGQSDSNWARCWWFPARDESETDLCGPSPGGGVESREAYDELVAQMRAGIWLPEWFGSCPTSELVFTVKAACNYTSGPDCAADPSCTLHPDLTPEYGMCRLRDDLIWDALFGAGSALFNATAPAMAECAAASDSLESCLAAGTLMEEDGQVPIDADKFGDVIDLVFIEEVTPGSVGTAVRLNAARTLLMAALAAAALLLAAAL